MKRLFIAVSVFVLTLAAAGVISAQSDARIGTWKLNVAKSKQSANPPRQSETRTYESSGNNITAHSEVVNGDGSKQVYGFDGTPDGKDHPYTGQQPGGAETLSVERAGNTFAAESKKDGKVLFTTKVTFSKDGKVMTLTTKGTDASGHSANSVLVYDKQ
jgi:hypothetical protein